MMFSADPKGAASRVGSSIAGHQNELAASAPGQTDIERIAPVLQGAVGKNSIGERADASAMSFEGCAKCKIAESPGSLPSSLVSS